MLFPLVLKRNVKEKVFCSVKTKPSPNFVVKLKAATTRFYCLFDKSHFSNICTLNT